MNPLPRRALLGAELPEDSVAFAGDGVAIAGVTEHGMAARAGMAAGDRLVALAGLPVATPCELGAALRAAGASPTAEVAYVRGGERVVRTVPVVATPCEGGAQYGELAVAGGARLRTIHTRAATPKALVLVLPGIACESVDHALTPEAPLAGLVAGWAIAGIDVLRFDKRGVGDSTGGPCRALDFATELADARAMFAHAATVGRDRGVPVIAYGHSVGGIVAPHVATAAAGIAVYGAPVMPWLACLADSTRRQLELRGAPPDEIDAEVAALEALRDTGDLNGRSAAYHRQLADVDVAAAWRAVAKPVLVLRGAWDWVVRPDDQARVAELASGPTTVLDVPGLDHLGGWHPDRDASLRDYGAGRYDDALLAATTPWILRVAEHARAT